MSLPLYNRAVLDKIKSWFSNTIYAHTAITYNVIYDLLDGGDIKAKMKFPLINIYRVSTKPSENRNFAARKKGLIITEDEITQLSGRFLAYDLVYQLDFYGKSDEHLEGLIIQIMHALEQYPVIEVIHTDNKTKETFTERYELVNIGEIVPQSEFDNNDRIYRAYIQYKISNARAYDITDYTKITEVDIGLRAHGTLQELELALKDLESDEDIILVSNKETEDT